MADNVNWYVVHTYSGYENTVKATIEKYVENRHLQDVIHEISIPLETVTEITDNGPKEVERKSWIRSSPWTGKSPPPATDISLCGIGPQNVGGTVQSVPPNGRRTPNTTTFFIMEVLFRGTESNWIR